MRTPGRTKNHLWKLLPTILLVATWILLFHGGGTLYFGPPDSDLGNYYYPMRVFVHRWLSQGIFPWWDPHVFSGYPVSETQQMALFYPASLATAALLSPRTGLLAITAAHVAIALAGMWFFARRGLRVSAAAAALGSAVYVFGALYSIRVAAGHFTVVAALSWWPWAMLGLVNATRAMMSSGIAEDHDVNPTGSQSRLTRLVSLLRAAVRALFRKRVMPWLLLAGLANAMVVLVGSPQYVVYLGWMQVAAAVVITPWRRWAAALVPVAGAWTLGLALSAPQWIPTLWYLPFSARASSSGGLAPPGRLDLINVFLEFVLPFPFGDDMRVSHLHMKNVWETGTYPGVAALILTTALAVRVIWRGIAALRMRAVADGSERLPNRAPFSPGQIRQRVPLVLLALGIFMIMGGWLPGFGGFREVLKARAVVAFAIAATAAAGFEVLRAQLRLRARLHPNGARRSLWPELVASAGLAVMAAATALIVTNAQAYFGRLILTFGLPYDPAAQVFWRQATDNPALASRQLILSSWAVAVGAAVVFLCVLGARHRPAAALASLVCFGALETFAIHSYSFYSRNPYDAIELPRSLVKWAGERLPASRSTSEFPWRVSLPPVLANRSHLMEGLYETAGYDPLMPLNANNRVVLHGVTTEALEDSETSERVRQLRHMVFARHYDLMTWRPFDAPPQPLNDETYPPVLKEASVVAAVRRVESGAPAPGMHGPKADGTTFVVPPAWAGKETPVEELPPGFRDSILTVSRAPFDSSRPFSASPTADLTPEESLHLLPRQRPDRYDMDVSLNAPALIVLRTTWLPGWKVRIGNGPAVRALVANHWIPAVVVPEGRHRVTFVYRPVALIPSLAVAGLSLMLVLGLLLWSGGKAQREERQREERL